MISSLRKYIKKELFNPSILGIFLNPFYFARKSLYKNIKDLAPNCKGKILDVGCGNKPYKNLFIHSNQYVGLEINRECKFADYFYDGSTFPFPDFCYDAVFSSQVLEHVLNPEEFINEIYRVLLPGGMLLLTTPFIWDEHAQPYDYRRYTSFGIRDLLEKHGFEVIEVRKSLNDFRIIAQSLNIYIYKKTLTKYTALNYLFTLFFMAPVNIFGTIFGKILPQNDDLYMDNIVLARKIRGVMKDEVC